MLWLFFNNSFWLGSQGVLCMLARCFVYARKVFCVCPQGREKASRTLHKGTTHLFRLLRAPRLLTSRSSSAYFGIAICLLWINRLLLMSCKQRHLWVGPKSSTTCSAVIYGVFRSHLAPVKWLGNGRKVTHLRMEGTSGTTQRDVRNKIRVATGVWRSLHDRREGVQCNCGWQYDILVVSFCRRLCFGIELAI